MKALLVGSLGLFATIVVVGCTPPATPTEPPTPEPAAAPPVEKTLYVAPELVDCTGVAPTQCMQVKETESGDWTTFYGSIDGFTYEPGYDYVLRVLVTTVPNPPADASSLSYSLLDVVSKTAAAQAAALEGPVWLLDAFGPAASPVAPAEGSTITARFDATAGTVAGSSGCNSYHGAYTVDGDTLSIGTLAGTLMACEEPLMTQETDYLAALQGAETFAIDGDTLTITGGGNVLTYHPQTAGLADTSWTVVGYNNGKEAVVSVLAGTTLTMTFTADTVAGNAGCNSFTGSYSSEGDSVSIGPLATTRMMCAGPQGVMDQETQFLAALQSAATYGKQADKLELRTADGALAVNAQTLAAQ